jgi:hypothetical protein
MGWLTTASEFEVTLSNGKVICRTKQGKILKTLPKGLAEDEAVVGLKQLVEWLGRHEASCRAEVDRWMIRSLPVPAKVLTQVWADDAWRAALTDLVVVPVEKNGTPRLDDPGFLREATDNGLGVVNLDGDSVRVKADRVAIPHPVRLDELDDLREFAAELGIRQGTLQLFREVWRKPADPQQLATDLTSGSGGRFEQLRHLTGRATSLGYQVRGGYATCRVWEDGDAVSAAVWVGAGDPGIEAETGDLAFADGQGQAVDLAKVGSITWSEGMRMAAALYAGRVVKKEEDA